MDIETIENERNKNKIQLEPQQLLEISKTLPGNFLVFGVGNDTSFWLKANKGHTIFLEDSHEWYNGIRNNMPHANIRLVEYHTQLKNGHNLLGQDSQLYMNLDPDILNTKWDTILVDAPPGYKEEHPGRMQSIYMASRLIKGNGHVFVHDCDREMEKIYTDKYLMPQNLIERIGTLNHYKINK